MPTQILFIQGAGETTHDDLECRRSHRCAHRPVL